MSLGKMDDLGKLENKMITFSLVVTSTFHFKRNVCPLDDIQARVMDENER